MNPSPHFPLPTFCLLLAACCLLPSALFAQKGKQKEPEHKLVFNIKDCKDNQMLLTIQFRGKHILKDSALNNGKGVFIFEGDKKYDEGMYSLISGSKKSMLDFIMDGNQKFTYYLDTTGNVNGYTVTGSPENTEMLRFQQKNVEALKKVSEWNQKRKEFEEKGLKDSVNCYMQMMRDLDAEMEQYITNLIAANPTFMFSKLQKSFREVVIPEPPVDKEGAIDPYFKTVYYRTHYWDNYDLTDRRFLFLPRYDTKVEDYFKKVLWYQDVDTIIKYMDMMLDKTRPDSLMYRYLVEYLSKEFENSNLIGHDAIFVHLANNNQLAGKCTWMDEDLIKRYKMRIEDLEPMLIGTKSVEMVLPDTTQTDDFSKYYSSYKMPKKYRVLWFYDHTCSHCHKESKELKAVYDSLANIGQLDFDVYAVNRTDDIAKWKKYIDDNGYTWINVGGAKGNIDWKEVYHITRNPQFYIINQDKIIILNRDIPKNMIPQFLKDYERIEAEKTRLKNKRQ
jgi:thioredoxin-related protein